MPEWRECDCNGQNAKIRVCDCERNSDQLIAKYGTSRHGHSIFAPSAAHRWKKCKGSLLINATSGDTAGYEAAEGTVAHTVAEIWNTYREKPEHLLGVVMRESAGGNEFAIEVTCDMLHHVERYVEWCAEVPGDHYFEQRVDLSEIMPIPGQGGTADHFACQPGILTITDLKYGTGVRVYAEENPQAMLYASGVFLEWDWIYAFQRIVIRICQPRLDVFEVWECTREELLDFMEVTRVEAKDAWRENAPLTPDPKGCRFCAIEETCPARLRQLDAIIDDCFTSDDDEPMEVTSYEVADLNKGPVEDIKRLAAAVQKANSVDLSTLSTRALARTLVYRQHVERFFAGIGDVLLDRAERGIQIPGFKVTNGRKTRKWKDTEEAVRDIQARWSWIEAEKLCPPTILSVAKAEKFLRAETKQTVAEVKLFLDGSVNVFSSKRGLAPDKDDRPDISELEEDFEADEDEL